MEAIKPSSGVNLATYLPVNTLSPQERADQQKLIRAVESVNGAKVFGETNELVFSFDRKSGRAVTRLVNKETNEVIRQIPSEKVLRLAEEV